MKRISCSWQWGTLVVLALALVGSSELVGQTTSKSQQDKNKKTKKQPPPAPNPTNVTGNQPLRSSTNAQAANLAALTAANNANRTPILISGQPFPALSGLGTPSFAGVTG